MPEALDRLEELTSPLGSDVSDNQLYAMGHAHLDAAWLWPWSETARKYTRSFSNALKLMEEHPEFTKRGGRSVSTELTVGFDVNAVAELTLIKDVIGRQVIDGNVACLDYDPHGIKTIGLNVVSDH